MICEARGKCLFVWFHFLLFWFSSFSIIHNIIFHTNVAPDVGRACQLRTKKKWWKKKNLNKIENLHWSLGLSVRACECWWFRPLTETSAWFTARKKKSELREILPLHSLAVLMAMAKVCVPVQVRFGVGDWGPKWRHDFAPPSTHGFYIIIIFNEYNVTCVCVCVTNGFWMDAYSHWQSKHALHTTYPTRDNVTVAAPHGGVGHAVKIVCGYIELRRWRATRPALQLNVTRALVVGTRSGMGNGEVHHDDSVMSTKPGVDRGILLIDWDQISIWMFVF